MVNESNQNPHKKDNKESIFRESKKALITAVIAIAFNPLSILGGYFISKTLEAPKLSIQYIEADIEKTPLNINSSLYNKILNNPYITNNIQRQVYYGCYMDFSKNKLNINDIKELLNALPLVTDMFKTGEVLIEKNIETVKAWQPGARLIVALIELPGLYDRSPQEVAKINKNDLIDIYESALLSQKNMIDDINRLEKELKSLSETNISRTGKVFFHIGILNSGDSDGVLYPEASLEFKGINLVLYCETGESNIGVPHYQPISGGSKSVRLNYSVIRSHSFAEIMFVIAESKSTPDDFKKWEKAVENKEQAEFRIRINAGGGKKLTEVGWLPPD